MFNNPVNFNDPSGENPAAIARALRAIANLYKTIKNIRCDRNIFHGPHHFFGYYYVYLEKKRKCGKTYYKKVKRKCFRKHIHIRCWVKGLKKKPFLEINIPYGKCSEKGK